MIARTVLGAAVDYAGLFPPAGLDMATAVRNYAAYREGPDAWALGRFVVGVGRLNELWQALREEIGGETGANRPWPVAAVGGGDPVAVGQAIQWFNVSAAGLARVDTLEWKADVDGDLAGDLARLPDGLHLYIELPLDRDPAPWLPALAGRGAAAKARTGGTEPALIPDPEAVLRFLTAVTAAGLPFKATAGLHHPVRGEYALTYEPSSPRAVMHGFLNVTMAALLLRAGAGEAAARDALVETDPGAFRLGADRFAWRDHTFSSADVRTLRERVFGSFGSCSFREPVDELAPLVET